MGSIPYYIKVAVIIAACVGVLYVVLGVFGVTVPPFLVTIFWILVAAFVAIVAINFLIRLAGGPPSGQG